jgi:hypothetical protein
MAERKIYKTMQGKVIDFDALRVANELVPAVGNMKVNARGDEIGPGGTVVRSSSTISEERIKTENANISQVDTFEEDFGPEPEISPEDAQKILNRNRKNKPQEE